MVSTQTRQDPSPKPQVPKRESEHRFMVVVSANEAAARPKAPKTEGKVLDKFLRKEVEQSAVYFFVGLIIAL